MKVNLTARGIESFKPHAAKRLEIPDAMLPGLYFIVQPSGRKGWAVRYRFSGKPCKLTLGAYPILNLADARSSARDALRAVAEGKDPARKRRLGAGAGERDGGDTVDDLGREFLQRHAAKNRTAAETERIFSKEVWPSWSGRRVGEITRRDVIDLIEGVVDRGSPVMANRVLAAVRKFFAWAASRDVIAISPVIGVKPPGAENSRDRILSDDELRWFWKGTERLEWPFGPIFRLLLLTAQRREEVGAIARQEIVGALWTIPASRAKNGRAHAVLLSAPVLEILSGLPVIHGNSDYLFTTTGNAPPSGYSRAKNRLDRIMHDIAREEAEREGRTLANVAVPHWVLHDLRRTAASGMARIGVQLPVIERTLNHVSGSFGGIVGVYQRHSFAEEMGIALEQWAVWVVRRTS